MKNDIVIAIGAAVKNLRMQKHLSLRDLEKKSGIGRSYIIRLEAGRGNPSFKQLGRIAKTLDAKLTVTLAPK